MSDKTPEPSEPDDPGDLESLLGGLDMTPDWAKGEPGVSQPSRKDRGNDRGRGGGPRRPGESSRRNLQGVRVKPRRDGPPRGGGGRGSRGDTRPDRPRDRRPSPPPRVPVHVDFIPEKKRLSKVVRVIRQSHKVFPLNVVAEKFMENPAFLSMKYTVREKEPEAKDFRLYVCKANGMVFSTEAACVQYVLDHGIEANYEKTEREVDPPSGNFLCVGRHRPSGKLIGPPNWHGYQPQLEALRQEVAADTPPEVFSSQIEMIRDEETIEAWKKEVSNKTFYREKRDDPQEREAPENPEGTAEGQAADKEPASESTAEPISESSETDAAPASEADPAGENVSGDESSAAPEPETDAQEPDEPETQTAPEPSDPPEPNAADDRPYGLTREQAEADFKEKYLGKLIGVTQRAIMPGYLFPKMTDPSLESLTRYHLRRESNRPNSIIFALRPAFKHMRLHVFRYDGDLMVSGVEGHPLPENLKVTAEIQQILDYVADHQGCHTKEALQAVATTTEEVPAEIVSHLRWLIEKGHLLEFHDETLHLPHARRR